MTSHRFPSPVKPHNQLPSESRNTAWPQTTTAITEMKSFLLAIALSGTCAISYAQWTLALYDEFKCSGSSTIISATANIGQACVALPTGYPSGTQLDSGSSSCGVSFGHDNQCGADGICDGFGQCCSENDEKSTLNSYQVSCEGVRLSLLKMNWSSTVS